VGTALDMTLALNRPVDPGRAAPTLTVTTTGDGPVWEVVLCGDLNADSTAALHSLAGQIGSGSFDEIVVDISELRSVDSAGTDALRTLGSWTRASGARLVVRDRGVLLPSTAD
jgi:anti-anti-sigma regulatory factor